MGEQEDSKNKDEKPEETEMHIPMPLKVVGGFLFLGALLLGVWSEEKRRNREAAENLGDDDSATEYVVQPNPASYTPIYADILPPHEMQYSGELYNFGPQLTDFLDANVIPEPMNDLECFIQGPIFYDAISGLYETDLEVKCVETEALADLN